MRGRSIVFVCTGNQCRSPMAEYLLRRRLKSDTAWQVRSAGTAAPDGFRASRNAVDAMAEAGIDIGAHRSRQITAEMVDDATLIVTMTGSQRGEILSRFPSAQGRVFTIGSLTAACQDADVHDPVGMDISEYRKIRDEIDDMMPDVVLFLHEQGGI